MDDTQNAPERPRTREDVVLRDLGREAMLYDPVTDRVVRLNATSRRVWELCDGEHDVVAIASDLAGRFEVAPDADLEADVRHALAAFFEAGLFAA